MGVVSFAVSVSCGGNTPAHDADVEDDGDRTLEDAEVETSPDADIDGISDGDRQDGDVIDGDTDGDTNHDLCDEECHSDEICRDGSCLCRGGFTRCGEWCRNLQEDFYNCGVCHNACGSGDQCNDGECVVDCSPPRTFCSGECVNVSGSNDHCGTCRNACEDGEECSNGICCSVGLTGCGVIEDVCVDTSTDRQHCGECYHVCDSFLGPECVDGECGVRDPTEFQVTSIPTDSCDVVTYREDNDRWACGINGGGDDLFLRVCRASGVLRLGSKTYVIDEPSLEATLTIVDDLAGATTNLATGTTFVLWDAITDTPITSNFNEAWDLKELARDGTIASSVRLSSTIELESGEGEYGMFAGDGYFLFFNGDRFISVTFDGAVTFLSRYVTPDWTACADGWVYGIAEFVDESHRILYPRDGNVMRLDLDEAVVDVAFPDAVPGSCGIVVSPTRARWYSQATYDDEFSVDHLIRLDRCEGLEFVRP